MVKIRLKRMGTTKRPVYRLVVADSRSPRDGRFIEAIGFYDPLPDPAVVRVDEEKVRVWMRRGARPSDSARQLLVRQGILQPGPRAQRHPSAGGATPNAARRAEPAAEGPTAEQAGSTQDGGQPPEQLPDTPGSIPDEAVEANPATLIEEASEGEADGGSAAADSEDAEAESGADATDAGDGTASGATTEGQEEGA